MLLVGDVHGEWENLADRLRQRDIRSTTILQVGDFGVGFLKKNDERRRLERLDRALDVRDLTLYAIRGNHHDPAYFAPDREHGWERIHLVPDYTLLTIGHQRILCVGGAISVDRRQRHVGVSYWQDEGFVFDPTALHAMDLSAVSAVVTAHRAVVRPSLAVVQPCVGFRPGRSAPSGGSERGAIRDGCFVQSRDDAMSAAVVDLRSLPRTGDGTACGHGVSSARCGRGA